MQAQRIDNEGKPPFCTLYTFGWVPEMVQGLVRDVRVRWALEEAGIAYEVSAVQDQEAPHYRSLQPFGQVPAYEEGDLELFESGAIVHHIASGSPALMPADPEGRAQTLTWMFAALNTIEPQVAAYAELDFFHKGEAWIEQRRPVLEEMLNKRFNELEAALGDKPYLLGRFTAADILMTTVLRLLHDTDLVSRHPVLSAYVERCNARPASRKALADHMAFFQ